MPGEVAPGQADRVTQARSRVPALLLGGGVVAALAVLAAPLLIWEGAQLLNKVEGGLTHSVGWKQADLDRNALNLELYRERAAAAGPGLLEHRFDGVGLSGAVDQGTVVRAGGSARLREGGDLYVEVRYDFSGSAGAFAAAPHSECWRFSTPDGYDVEFEQVGCR